MALAREVLGGNGVVTDFHVAKQFCDMEAIYTYEVGRSIIIISSSRSSRSRIMLERHCESALHDLVYVWEAAMLSTRRLCGVWSQ